MTETWELTDNQILELKRSPALTMISTSSFELPQAARICDNMIVVFSPPTVFKIHDAGPLEKSLGVRFAVDVIAGNLTQTVTGEAAKIMWTGLCLLSVDWRKLAGYISAKSPNSP